MQFKYRLALRAKPTVIKSFESLGFEYKLSDDFLISFADTSHPNWSALVLASRNWGGTGLWYTEFSDSELSSASWLKVRGTDPKGYPQPEDNSLIGYKSITYDRFSFCPNCQRDKKQVASFRLKRIPNLRPKSVMVLNWVPDVLFVHRELYESVFQLRGIGYLPVQSSGGTKIIEDIVQVDTREAPRFPLLIPASPDSVCPECGIASYMSRKLGPSFPFLKVPDVAMTGHVVRSEQYFGGGWSNVQHIYFSQELVYELRKLKVRGLEITPVAKSVSDLVDERTLLNPSESPGSSN